MLTYNKEVPVLLLIFNRLDTTLQVFEKIRMARPQRLYIAADGPRNDQEKDICEKVRNIVNGVDWDCTVKTLFREKNLGCRLAVSQAITWLFKNEQEGIILEDDCVPSDSFFGFCSTLLEKYRNDERIGHISGGNYQNGITRGDGSYYFSALTNIWGWATWQRVWKDYDVDMLTYPIFKNLNYIDRHPSYGPFKKYWDYFFQAVYNRMSTWDYQYSYLNLVNHRLSIISNVNLISNIGFAENVETTHPCIDHPYGNIPFQEMNKIVHPTFMIEDTVADLEAQTRDCPCMFLPIDKDDKDFFFLKDKLIQLVATMDTDKGLMIPKIIHQIYDNPQKLSESLQNVSKTWKEYHPDWEFYFWDKTKMEEFLHLHYPDFVQRYESFPYDMQRWDAIRPLILYHYGGMYVDIDYECFTSLEPLLLGASCCMGLEPKAHAVRYDKPFIVGSALMATVPRHPYFKMVIEELKENGLKKWGKHQIIESTGPFMLTRIYNSYPCKEDITLIPAELIAPLSKEEVQEVLSGHATEEMEEKVEKAFAMHYFLGLWIPDTIRNLRSQKIEILEVL